MPVQTLQQVMKSLGGVYNPQVSLLQKRQSGIPQSIQAEETALGAKQTQAYDEILGGARRRGLGFAGIPLQEQAKYNSTEYMPALARLKQSGREQAMSLEEAILGVRERQTGMANQIREGMLSRAMANKQMREERRRFDLQLAESRRASAAAASAASAMPSFGFGGEVGGGSTGGSAKGNKIQAQAEANLQNILSKGNDYNTLRSDLLATVASAQRGNKIDQAKIQLYRGLVANNTIPNIFRAELSTPSTANRLGWGLKTISTPFKGWGS